jgi:hypothetical protein
MLSSPIATRWYSEQKVAGTKTSTLTCTKGGIRLRQRDLRSQQTLAALLNTLATNSDLGVSWCTAKSNNPNHPPVLYISPESPIMKAFFAQNHAQHADHLLRTRSSQ